MGASVRAADNSRNQIQTHINALSPITPSLTALIAPIIDSRKSSGPTSATPPDSATTKSVPSLATALLWRVRTATMGRSRAPPTRPQMLSSSFVHISNLGHDRPLPPASLDVCIRRPFFENHRCRLPAALGAPSFYLDQLHRFVASPYTVLLQFHGMHLGRLEAYQIYKYT